MTAPARPHTWPLALVLVLIAVACGEPWEERWREIVGGAVNGQGGSGAGGVAGQAGGPGGMGGGTGVGGYGGAATRPEFCRVTDPNPEDPQVECGLSGGGGSGRYREEGPEVAEAVLPLSGGEPIVGVWYGWVHTEYRDVSASGLLVSEGVSFQEVTLAVDASGIRSLDCTPRRAVFGAPAMYGQDGAGGAVGAVAEPLEVSATPNSFLRRYRVLGTGTDYTDKVSGTLDGDRLTFLFETDGITQGSHHRYRLRGKLSRVTDLSTVRRF